MTPDYLHRLAVAVAAVTYPGYRFWACGDHLHLAGAHVDVTTGERREMLWRRAWPGDVLAAADTGADTLPVLVAELVFAELAREHAHEIAEWLGAVRRGRGRGCADHRPVRIGEDPVRAQTIHDPLTWTVEPTGAVA